MSAIFPISFSKLPKRLILIGFLFVMIPLISYLATAREIEKPIYDYKSIFTSLAPPTSIIHKRFPISQKFYVVEVGIRYYKIMLNLMAFVIGVGLLGVKRWAYFLFLTFNFILIIDSIYRVFNTGLSPRIVYNLLLTLFYFIILQYFLSKDISTPYLTLVPRSFRRKWRIEIPVKGTLITIPGEKYPFTTIDISPGGCLAKIDGNIELGQECKLVLELDENWVVEAVPVRREGDLLGLQFSYSNSQYGSQKKLSEYLQGKLLPRYYKKIFADVYQNNKKIDGYILNISEGGFFFVSDSASA